MRWVRLAMFSAWAATAVAQPLPLTGDITGIHDPVIIRERDTYWVFSTNTDAPPATIRMRSSRDLRHWTARGHVFDKLPGWAPELIPGARGAWAPDITFVDGRYLLYYSVSTFGSNRSAVQVLMFVSLAAISAAPLLKQPRPCSPAPG